MGIYRRIADLQGRIKLRKENETSWLLIDHASGSGIKKPRTGNVALVDHNATYDAHWIEGLNQE